MSHTTLVTANRVHVFCEQSEFSKNDHSLIVSVVQLSLLYTTILYNDLLMMIMNSAKVPSSKRSPHVHIVNVACDAACREAACDDDGVAASSVSRRVQPQTA